MAGDDPDGNERLLAHPKSNTGAQAPTLRYRIERREIHHDGETIETCAVVWLGVAEGVTAADMLGEHEPEQRSERDEAAKWLEAYLRDRGGEAPAGETIKAPGRMASPRRHCIGLGRPLALRVGRAACVAPGYGRSKLTPPPPKIPRPLETRNLEPWNLRAKPAIRRILRTPKIPPLTKIPHSR